VKFQVDRDVMAEAVNWASRSLPTKSTNPLLTGLHIVADRDGIVLSGSDADVSARVNLAANVAEAGTILVPGRLLADITRSLPSSNIDVSVEGPRATITCGRSSFTIPTMPVTEYPPLPNMPEISGSVSGSEFANAIAQVFVAASRDETLPAFTGIKVDVEGSLITLAATDRYRLAIRELEWSPAQTSLSTNALVPARFLSDTAKSLATSDLISLAFASVNEGIVGVEGAGRQTTSRMLAADFPKYRSLLPSESTTVAQVSTASLAEAVKRVALVLDREQPVKITFTATEAIVTGGGGSGDIAQAQEYVECTTTGDEISIAFNPVFLQDGLNAIDAPIAVISMTAPAKPAVITGAADMDAVPADEFKYLLMPIRQP
jgi:DNA polymerase-3 subunit beta